MIYANQYACFVKYLYSHCYDSYCSNQMEEIFEPMVLKKICLLEYMEKRLNYTYENHVYTLSNPITNQIITIKINEYAIEVNEDGGNHVIFDILNQSFKNFYMIVS